MSETVCTDPATRKPKLLTEVRRLIRTKHYSRRTEGTYCDWIRRFIPSTVNAPPRDMREERLVSSVRNAIGFEQGLVAGGSFTPSAPTPTPVGVTHALDAQAFAEQGGTCMLIAMARTPLSRATKVCEPASTPLKVPLTPSRPALTPLKVALTRLVTGWVPP